MAYIGLFVFFTHLIIHHYVSSLKGTRTVQTTQTHAMTKNISTTNLQIYTRPLRKCAQYIQFPMEELESFRCEASYWPRFARGRALRCPVQATPDHPVSMLTLFGTDVPLHRFWLWPARGPHPDGLDGRRDSERILNKVLTFCFSRVPLKMSTESHTKIKEQCAGEYIGTLWGWHIVGQIQAVCSYCLDWCLNTNHLL